MNLDRKLDIVYAPIGDVVLWDKNPRGIKKDDYLRLKKQIKRLRLYKPLVAYRSGKRFVVLGGNMRLRALRELGANIVALSIVSPKSEAEKLAYNVSDNDRAGYYEEGKLAELAYAQIGKLDLETFKVDLGEPWLDLKQLTTRVGPDETDPAKAWSGMPEFDHEDQTAFRSIVVHFKDQAAVDKFARAVKHKITKNTRYIWYPEMVIERLADKRYKGES